MLIQFVRISQRIHRMELASKEMAEKKEQSESVQNRNTNSNGVVITVYVESVTTRSEDSIKKTKPHPHFTRPRAAGTHGHDRRAQLLAHSRELRNEGSEKVPLPTNQSLPKTKSKKGIWLTQPVRICWCSPSTPMPQRSSRRSRYERMASKESIERNRSKMRNSSRKYCPPFLSKLKNMMKELSCKEI